MRSVSVLKPGLLTTLQDAGRPGYAHLGIGRSGAADRSAMCLANALAGNAPGACVLEMTLAGPTLEFSQPAHVALTGAPVPAATLNGETVPMWRAVTIPSGAVLRVGPVARGCRTWLAIAGGINVDPWLGSRCTDVNAGLGPVPRALATGEVLPLGAPDTTNNRPIPTWSIDPRPWFDAHRPCTIRLVGASHTRALDTEALRALATQAFSVHPDSNRTGLRLAGPRLRLRSPLELISEGVVPGIMQLPPDGQPIILGWEHPVTGGYPRIAQVAAVDLPRLAQCRPGDTLCFQWISRGHAGRLLERRNVALQRLITRIRTRLEAP